MLMGCQVMQEQQWDNLANYGLSVRSRLISLLLKMKLGLSKNI